MKKEEWNHQNEPMIGSSDSLEQQSCSTLPLLAIDGGGTKTIAVITDEQGQVLATGKGSTSNYHVSGKEEAMETLKKVIQEAVNQYKQRSNIRDDIELTFRTGVFALAGFDTKKDRVSIESMVQQVIGQSNVRFQQVVVENDALSALLGATQHHPGILLISGTGSIAFAHDGKGNYYRSGGWGHLIGDEGSGYWIGMAAINAILKMHDGRGPKTKLADFIFKQLQLNSYEHLYNWVYSSNYSIDQIASLSTFVEQAYQEGDSVCQAILDRAVFELYQLICGVGKKSGIITAPFKLLFLGGILQNSEYISQALAEKVRKEMPNVEILTNDQKPIDLIIQRGLKWDGKTVYLSD